MDFDSIEELNNEQLELLYSNIIEENTYSKISYICAYVKCPNGYRTYNCSGGTRGTTSGCWYDASAYTYEGQRVCMNSCRSGCYLCVNSYSS